MVLLNWGSSNLRAYRVAVGGDLLEQRTSARGALTVEQGGFPAALLQEIGDWLEQGETHILMCGMVGGRHGWKEAPYVALPADLPRIADRVVPLPLAPASPLGRSVIRIVPGLSGCDDSGTPEVMRGEETEILGCIASPPGATLCLPGTHSKWVEREAGRILGFSTCMTGELFAVIRAGTVLGRTMVEGPPDAGAFHAGVERSRQPGELAHQLFGVRTLALTGHLAESAAASYLSGLLIGHEVRGAGRRGMPVHLIGEASLSELYVRALRVFGVETSTEPPGADLRGLLTIARQLAW